MTRVDEHYDVVIIGAGVVGCAIAYEAAQYRLNTLVIEKGNDVADGITKANSGVIHAGFNVPYGTLKARLNVEGARILPCLCERLSVPVDHCGKLVIARNDMERRSLSKLLEQGRKNHARGLSLINGEAIHRLAPYVRAKWALLSRRTSVVSPYLLTIRLAEAAHFNGVQFRFNQEASGLTRENGRFLVQTAAGASYSSDLVVNAAGLYSARLAAAFDGSCRKRIFPFRGQYLVLDSAAAKFVTMAVYPVPPQNGKGLGVHVTPTTNGAVIIGPSAEYVDTIEDTSTTFDVLKAMRADAASMIPELEVVPAIKSYAGLRPKLVEPGRDGAFEDFYIRESDRRPGLYNLIGIESPGLTAAPAIARYLLALIGEKRRLSPNRGFRAPPKQRKVGPHGPRGEVLCSCHAVTRAQIVDAVRNPFGAKSLTAIKKRTDAMAGACQGQFCMPKIVRMLLEEEGLDPEELIQDGAGSTLVERGGRR